ncbi:4'-phosphopantetheinyl transferase family protein [Herbaspirillum sp. alder98]|uniref:4'-phosphopantetheinyl transferase family protein n=1 Tax=Herbaspirillum sp. alder98 TaxID=2913096 RepID=UPI001CD88310|nr:4'-phosphopantetheinyl transferase superfamily protein [Herbaspirillum sp. alder98]MCA1324664.1 4'-phosphopantetheinyl transferase superfamily protein [Herbaspirillum sp. alder98]
MTTAWLTLLDARALLDDVDDALLQSLAQHLGPAEQALLPGFVRQRRRREFILGRLLLRHDVTRVTACPMHQIEVIERAGAGPQIVLPTAVGDTIEASLSHGGGWIACAIGTGFALGLDIETSRAERDLSALAQTAFSAAERRWLHAQIDVEKAFYQLWCGKEALYKYGNNAGLPTLSALPQLQCDDLHAAPGVGVGADLTLIYSREAAMHLTLCCPSHTEVKTEKITLEELLKRFTYSNK